jgi:hypothetical protein
MTSGCASSRAGCARAPLHLALCALGFASRLVMSCGANVADAPIMKIAAEQLTIAPSQHSKEALKRILGGAVSVVEGLGCLRNKIGDAHGRGKRPVKPSARHAQLAVNIAGAAATFHVETWEARQYEEMREILDELEDSKGG